MKHVLIVDDDRTVCRCMEKLIDWKSLGYESPKIAYNGVEALDRMGEEPIQVVITDIRMPAMNGVSLTEKIKERYPETRIVFFSAYEDFAAAQAGIRYGIKRYVMKPINRESLRTVEQILKDIACEIEENERYRELLREGDDRDIIFSALYRKDLSHFEKIFNGFSHFSREQAQSLALLFLNALVEFVEHKADVHAKDRLNSVLRHRGDSQISTAEEWGGYTLRAYTAVCMGEGERLDNKADILVDRILKSVLEEYGNVRLNVAWLAREMNYTPHYISKIFCERTGVPISSFIIQTRMRKAEELLRNTQMSVAEIAWAVGYPDANYFAKAFHKMVGLSPTDYRKNYQERG